MSDPVLDEITTEEIERDETDAPQEPDELVAETLVEEVSIDGMCGVY